MANGKDDKTDRDERQARNEAGERRLEALQLAMVETQSWLIDTGQRVLIVFEARDAAGKDGTIKALTANMSARQTRAVSLPKPTERERGQWYFQRYVTHLPAAGEVVIFNRSWYNRAGVEPVMGFCTPEESETFLRHVPLFEAMLVESGIRLVKYWLDISRAEQRERLDKRRGDPIKALKVSPLDARADEKWDAYTAARDSMLTRTSTPVCPWTIVRGNDKSQARIAVHADLVARLGCPKLTRPAEPADPSVLASFAASQLSDGWLQR